MEDFKMGFDIQKFADEDAAEGAAAEQDAAQGGEPSQEQEEIPAELEGLPEDIAREAMAEANAEGQDAQPAQEAQQETQIPPETIPYPRFKQEVDKGASKDEEIARLKAEIESMRRQAAQPAQATPQGRPEAAAQGQPLAQKQGQSPALTKETAQLVSQAIHKQAMQMAGMTAEDLDSLEYMDESDPRKQQWEFAQEMAKNQVFGRIRDAWVAQQQQAQQFLARHQRSVEDFNAFAQQQKGEPDFAQLQEYAREEYYGSLPQQEKEIIAEAYARVERNVASPQEIYLIKKYFEEAKAAYRSQHPVAASAARGGRKAAKAEQAKTFPRASQIQGAGGAGNGVTVASLEKMLDEMPIDQIDPKFIKMLQG